MAGLGKLLPLVLFAAVTFSSVTSVSADAPTIEEKNKEIVLSFYEKALNQKDFAAAEKYFGSRYIQHNPAVPNGPDGLKGLLTLLKEKFPNAHSEIKHIYADGDIVILHVHSVRVPGEPGNAIVDIFKLEDGKIVEHWDVIQKIPETAANTNTMF